MVPVWVAPNTLGAKLPRMVVSFSMTVLLWPIPHSPAYILFGAPQYPPKPRKSKGHLRVEHAEIKKKSTLLDFLAGGLQLSMMVSTRRSKPQWRFASCEEIPLGLGQDGTQLRREWTLVIA